MSIERNSETQGRDERARREKPRGLGRNLLLTAKILGGWALLFLLLWILDRPNG